MDNAGPPEPSTQGTWQPQAHAPTVHMAQSGEVILPAEPTLQIGRYRVLDRLGAGGMGVVYAAYDPELDRTVAIKLIYGDSDARGLQRSQELLRREAQALAKLAHPNIVAIHDVGVHAGQVFVAMEFVVGRTMRQWWEQHEPDWQEVLAAMVQAGRGIIAAHAAGLVHRDIKPDNLLIGDDGRVRVADFGIARHAPNAAPSTPIPYPSGSGRELATIGERGALIGTPAYMPPEQHDGGEVGPHSDQFSFCVTLWEGLFGQRPFVGEAAKLPGIIRAGVPTRPEGAPELPAWLAQAVRRGLSPRFEDRWPSMQALLDVLALDFAARRARRNWRVLFAALAAVVGVALVLGGRSLQAVRARDAAERAAAARLVGVGASVQRLLARDLRDEAEETLRAFVEEPELRDTQAAIDAWLLWADHMEARSDRAAAQAAVVEAYTALPPDDPREPAIALRIAQQFRGAWKFAELAALGDQVAQRWPDAAHTAAWTRLRAEAALARGDLAGFLAQVDAAGAPGEYEDIAPALRALASASCPLRDEMLVYPTDWPGNPGQELLTIQKDGITIRRMDTALTPVGPRLDGLPLHAANAHPRPLVRVPGGPSYLIGHAHPPINEMSLIELGDAGSRELLRWSEDGPGASATADLDGDGVRELYVGTTAYTRKLYRLDPDAAGVWQRRLAHLPTDATHSDINALVPGDFNGDGHEELAAAVGAWRAYDVRIFEAAPDGELRIAARRRFGHVTRMASLRAADGQTLLVLAKDETAPSKEAWPPGEPQGEATGIHIVRRSGDTIVQVAHFPWPAQAHWFHPQRATGIMVGDVDGDGLQDVVVALGIGAPFATSMVIRQRRDGFASAALGGATPLLVGNFDADPADEVLATVRRGETIEGCLFGVAGAPVAAIPAPQRSAATPPLADPMLTRAWTRAENLASFGLHGDAARALERRITLAEDEADRRALRRRSAELYEAAGDAVQAGEHFEALADEGDVAAAVRAVANYEEALRLPEALGVAQRALGRDGLPAAQASELRLAQQRLTAVERRETRVELRFDGPLDPAWQIEEPLALRIDPVHSELIVEASADMRTLASLPIVLTGEPLTLEFDLDVDRAEWGAGLAVSLRSVEGDELVADLAVGGGGGGGHLVRNDTFAMAWDLGIRATPNPAERTTHRMRALFLPAHGRMQAEERGSDPDEMRRPLARPLRPGPHTLLLRAPAVRDGSTQQIRGRVRRIGLLGARLAAAPAPAGAHADLARALASGAWQAALAIAVDDTAETRLWRATALAELGRSGEAIAAFTSLDPDDPQIRHPLAQLLRTRLTTFAPLLRTALGPRYPALLLESLQKGGEYDDDELAAQRLTATLDLEGLPVASDAAGRTTMAALLAIRGGVWSSSGKLAQAEADLAAAAALFEQALPATDTPDADLATIELRLAELAARRGRVDDAIAAASRALQRATDPAWMAERLLISPAMRPVLTDPRCQRLLATYRQG